MVASSEPEVAPVTSSGVSEPAEDPKADTIVENKPAMVKNIKTKVKDGSSQMTNKMLKFWQLKLKVKGQ